MFDLSSFSFPIFTYSLSLPLTVNYSALLVCILALNLFSDFLQHKPDYILESMGRRMSFSFFIKFCSVGKISLDLEMQHTVDS